MVGVEVQNRGKKSGLIEKKRRGRERKWRQQARVRARAARGDLRDLLVDGGHGRWRAHGELGSLLSLVSTSSCTDEEEKAGALGCQAVLGLEVSFSIFSFLYFL